MYIAAYAFLLRVPSEALPISICMGSTDVQASAAMYFANGSAYLSLATRKNRPRSNLLRRSCWCADCRLTCPVHALWEWAATQGASARPFIIFSASSILRLLRARLESLEVALAASHRTPEFRRGHARDMQEGGRGLYEILSAGEWNSPAFMPYLDVEDPRTRSGPRGPPGRVVQRRALTAHAHARVMGSMGSA